MKFNYEKLTADLIKAKKAAENAAKGEDKGSINLDTLTIFLPRAGNQKVITAVKEAGLYTSGARNWNGRRFFINPPPCGQSSSRKRTVQAMFESMKLSGWEVLIHSEADYMLER